MLNSVIRFSLRHRPLIVMLSLTVLLYGGYVMTQMPMDVLPDMDRPRVVIVTEAHGLAPQDIEQRISQPIEIAMLGSPGVQAVRSASTPSQSLVTVEFDWGTGLLASRQIVQERLATVTTLPPNVKPVLAPVSSILGQIMYIGFHRQRGPQGGELAAIADTELLSERLDGDRVQVWNPQDRRDIKSWQPIKARISKGTIAGQYLIEVDQRTYEVVFATPIQQRMELATKAAWIIRPRLLQIQGVAEVFQIGADVKQYQVVVDPDALESFRVSLEQVEQAVKESNVSAAGGFAVAGENERPIRIQGLLGPLPADVLNQLMQVTVKPDKVRPVKLGDVAKVREGPQPKRGDAGINGNEGIIITVAKQPHLDTRRLTLEIEKTLREIESSLTADYVITPNVFQLKRFIDQGLYHVSEALVIGAVLVLIVLSLFLLNVRTSFISLTAIPLSLAITALVFRLVSKLTGTPLNINMMTLGGLAVAMGELVDDAIVDVENIFRRLRENRALPQPRSSLRVVYEASVEVRGAIVFGTAVVILVFIPLFALSGIEGRLFTPLGIAYIVAILASLVVSLTVTPVLASYLLSHARATHHTRDSWLLRGLKTLARPMIRFSMKFTVILLLLTWIGVGVAAWLLTQLGSDFLPKFDEGSIGIDINLPPGSSLEASNRVCAIADRKLRSLLKTPDNPDGVLLHFARRTGRAEFDEHSHPVNMTEYMVSVNPQAGIGREPMRKLLEKALKEELPGVDIETEQPLNDLISHVISGTKAQIAIKIQGDDLNQLSRIAAQVKDALRGVDGVSAVIESQRLTDEIHIKLRPDDLLAQGVRAEYVAHYLETALQGVTVSQVIEGTRRFNLVVRFDESLRDEPSQLGSLKIDLPDGRRIRLNKVADVGDDQGANVVYRDNGRRRLIVRCKVMDRDLGSAAEDIEKRLSERVKVPAGYVIEFAGQLEAQRRATRLIVILSLVSLLAVFMTLLILYPSVRIVLQVLNAVPAAFIGGVIALTITGQTLTVASLVGFVSLAGIAVRNGILLMSHYVHLMKHEGEGFTQQMIERGSLERLAPVLMTALTAGIALVPLVIGGHRPGLEILYPVATVILGGLMTSTLCEFLLHPGLFWQFSGKDGQRLAAHSTEHHDL